jgi:hypothetical protein
MLAHGGRRGVLQEAPYTVKWTSNLVGGAWSPIPDGTVWPISSTGWTSGVPIVEDAFFLKVISDVP